MKRFYLFLSLALMGVTSIYANSVADDNGVLPGFFTINSDCDAVCFSQGNLQYVGTWQFAAEQWECFRANQSNNHRDLFGWGTGNNPNLVTQNNSDYSTFTEWGTNAITNGGNNGSFGWRSMTRSEMKYILTERANATSLRQSASVHGIIGMLLLPDGWTIGNSAISGSPSGTISDQNWAILEKEGAVFLPNPYLRRGTNNTSNTRYCIYWSSTKEGNNHYEINMDYGSLIGVNSTTDPYIGGGVRLVKEVPSAQRKASVATAPAAVPDLAFNNSAQALIIAGKAVNGKMKYRKGTSGSFSTSIPTETNAGTYRVYYRADGFTSCIGNSTEQYIDVTIAKGNLDLSGLTVEGDELTFTGSLQELLTVTGSVSGATIHYSTDGVDFSSTEIPKASAAGNHDVWYRVVPNDAVNYNTPDPVHLVVTIAYPTVSEDASPASVLSALYNGGDPIETSLLVNRTIYADGEYNTICLPFSLSAEALALSPLAGKERLKAFKGATVTGSGQDLYIDIFVEDATAIEAGVPYLITFPAGSGNLTSLIFDGIQVTTTSPSEVSANGVTFRGIFGPTHIFTYEENTAASRNEDYLFVGSGSQLFWPNDDGSDMPGFRAYFIVDRAAGSPISLAPKGTRARIMDAPKTTTGIDELSTTVCTKLIENGQLYIIKNGVKYNAQGQIVK